MIFILGIIFVSLLGVGAHPTRNELFYEAERECGKDFSRLWLDIVFVVDVSKGMTDGGLQAVRAWIGSFFLESQPLGVHQSNPYTTRVGLVVYDKAATVAFDLNQVTSAEVLENRLEETLRMVTQSDTSDLFTGLYAATDLLDDNHSKEKTGVSRYHYRKLMVVFSSSYKVDGMGDPAPIAERIKNNGISISTIAWGQDVGSYLKQLAAIASPRFGFTYKTATIDNLRNVALEVNCHCPNGWYQLRNEKSHPIGVCLRPGNFLATWRQAEKACTNFRNGAHLVHVYSKAKDSFIQEKLSKSFEEDNNYSYFIGLKWDKDRFVWDQETRNQAHGYEQWGLGYPKLLQSDYPFVMAKQVSINPRKFEWQNVDSDFASKYVCEMPSCDSTNYCEPEIN